MSGKVKYVGSPTADFSTNTEYDIIQLTVNAGNVVAIVLDDNGALRNTDNLAGADWDVVELYASAKVV